MAIITIPASPQKGQMQSYSLNVTELNTLVSDNYFKDQQNLKAIDVVYQSAVSNQLQVIKFIPSGSMTLSSQAIFVAEARDLFGIQSISIIDDQNGRYQIKASEIPNVASYDINFNIVPPMPNLVVTRRFSESSLPQYWSEETGAAFGGVAIISDGFLKFETQGGIYRFRYDATAITSYIIRVSFDGSLAFVGMQLRAGGEFDLYSLTEEDISRGYFETVPKTIGFAVSNAPYFIVMSAMPSGKSLKISKIELGLA